MSSDRERERRGTRAGGDREEAPAPVPGKYSSADLLGSGVAGPYPPTPGRRTQAEALPPTYGKPVQRRTTAPTQVTPSFAQRAAADGVAHASAPLPHLDAIQRSFGPHDVSDIRAQVGGPAEPVSGVIGASAYAQGNRVAFSAAPDLRTAAHEAAHVVQQRSGRAPAGGLDTPGDALEQHADAVADHVVAGDSAAGLLDTIVGGTGESGGNAVQRKPSDAPKTSAEIRALLERYLYDNSHHVWPAIGDHIRSVQLPTPNERLTWVDYDGFVIKLLKQIETAIGKFSPIAPLDEILWPTDTVKTLGALLPSTIAWYPEIGIAVAQALHIAIVASVERLALRYLEVADSRGVSGEGGVQWTELVTSAPIDRYVAVALCWPHVVTAQPLDPKQKRAASRAKPGLRPITNLSFEGERDRALWNWVRVEPADATAEEVAAQIWRVTDGHGDTSASFNAYLLAAAPPLFGVPKHIAINEPLFKRYTPPSAMAGEDSVDAELLQIGTSSVADEVARAPTPTATGKPEAPAQLGAILEALRDCELQLGAISTDLAPWGLDASLSGALAFVKRRQSDLAHADTKRLAEWATPIEGQKARLVRIGGGIHAVSAASKNLGAKDHRADQAAPIREILELFATAAGISHFARPSEQKLEQALQLQATLSVRALQATQRDMMGAIHEVHQQAGDNKHTGDLSHEAVMLQERSVQLQSQLLNGEQVDPDALDDVSAESEEVTLESRMFGALEALGHLNQAARAAGHGDAAIIASLFSGEFRNLPQLTKHIFDELLPIRDSLKSAKDAIDGELALGGGSVARKAYLRDARRTAIADARTRFKKLSTNRDLEHFFVNGAKLIQNQQFRTAVVKAAAMIGISIVGGAVAGLAARAVGGMLMEATGAATLEDLGYAAKAGKELARTVVDTTISSAGTAAIQGTSFKEAWEENLITGLATSAVFGTINSYVEEQARNEARVVKRWSEVGKLGKLAIAAKEAGAISVHTIWGAAMGEVASRMVTGKAQPPPETLREWALQGVSVAIGRHVSQRLMANSKLYKAIEESAENKGRGLVQGAARLQALAKRVISSKQPELALQLLNEHDQFMRREIEAVDRAITRTGDPTGELRATRQNLEIAAQFAGSEGMLDTKFTLIGMEELIPGALWKGNRAQIEQAIGQARQDKQNPEVLSHDPEAKRWRIRIGGREIEIQEVVSAAKTVDAERIVLAGSDEDLQLMAKLVPPESGALDVIVHGSVDDFIVDINGDEVHLRPRELAEYIKKQGIKFKRIRLLACKSGMHPKGAAQHLANKLGVPVEAPSDKLYIHPDGTLTIGPAPTRNTGSWLEYEPQRSELRYKPTQDPEAPQTASPTGAHDSNSPAKPLGATDSGPAVDVQPTVRLDESNVDYVIERLQSSRTLRPEEIAMIRRQARNAGEKWNLPDPLRGEVAHILAGENLPRTFRKIDKVGPIDARGRATEITSIKTHQLYSDTFKRPGALLGQLTIEINDLAAFPKQAELDGVIVRRGPKTKLVLEVEVPPNTLSTAPGGDAALRKQWREEAAQARKYAATKGVQLVFRSTR